MESEHPTFLFVCGCPRSGTTALWQLLCASPRIVLGLERYGSRFPHEALSPSLFTRERFFDCRPGDTFYDDLDAFHPYYATARERFAAATIVGDKLPKLYERFEALAGAFPEARIVFAIRNPLDVAASYKARAENRNDPIWDRDEGVSAALRDWSRSLRQFAAWRDRLRAHAVCYERLFGASTEAAAHELESLFAFVGTPLGADVHRAFDELRHESSQREHNRKRDLSQDEVFEISRSAPFETYRALLEDREEASCP